MGSLSDTMRAGSLRPSLESVHGEPIKVLDGVDAGKTFIGVITHEQDIDITSDTLSDPREKIMLRFTNRPNNVPSVNAKRMFKLQTQDGKKWSATKQDFSAYLSVDFQLVQTI